MSAVLIAFGVDWRLLIINILNFCLLLLVLWYFLYAPLMRMLTMRREKLAQGVHDAEAAAHERRAIAEARSDMLAQAGREADEVLVNARTTASEKQRELLEQAQASAAALVHEAEVEAREMKHTAIEESKKEVAKLVVLGMERALSSNK